jgi:hypothetical protein
MAMTLVSHDGFGGAVSFTSLSGRTPDILSGGGTWVVEFGTLRHGSTAAMLAAVNTGGAARGYISDVLADKQAISADFHLRGSYRTLLARFTTGSVLAYDFSGYMVSWEVGGLTLWELAGGSNNAAHWSSLGTASPSFSAGDVVYLECDGSQITVKVNGVSQISVVDSGHASGSVGVFSDLSSDDWLDNVKTYQDLGIVRRWILGTH